MSDEIIDLLFALRDEHDVTLVIATHNPDLAGRCDCIVHVRNGRIV